MAQVCAGLKHTLVLDQNNRIWYFGLKENIGINCVDELCQFLPIRLKGNTQANLKFNWSTSLQNNSFLLLQKKQMNFDSTVDYKKTEFTEALEKEKEYVFLAAGNVENFALELGNQILY